MKSAARFDAVKVRRQLIKRGMLRGNFVRYAYRPLDLRWLYWEPETKLLDEKRAEYRPHVFEGNAWLEAREKQTKEDFSRGTVTTHLADNFGNGLSHFFPMYLREEHDHGDGPPVAKRPNLTASASARLDALGLGVEDLFPHVVAVLHSPAYRGENTGALRMDWPRLPFPDDRGTFEASAALGRDLAVLLEPERPAPHITTGGLRPEIKAVGVPAHVGGSELAGEDFALTANWGSRQGAGAVMPGKGRVVERDYAPDEIQAFAAGAGPLGLTTGQMHALLGETTFDVYLNDAAYWRNVPRHVWEYKLGGYQVVKKWLSYRERAILGRTLRPEEVREVSEMVRRIAAILLLCPALDANYEVISGSGQ